MDVTIIQHPAQTLYGLWTASSDRTVSKDIPALSKRYYAAIGRDPGTVLPFMVLSKDYDEKAHTFSLFIGGTTEHNALKSAPLPEGLYGQITVRPKLGFLWGPAIGEAKRYFYAAWLPGSPYTARNMEYELHTEKSVGKKPEITLLFSIEKKAVE